MLKSGVSKKAKEDTLGCINTSDHPRGRERR